MHLGNDEPAAVLVGDGGVQHVKKDQQQPGSEAATAAAAAAAEAAVVASVPLPPPLLLQPGLARPNCEYLQLCQRFKLSLSLPSAYFSSSADNAVCHCQSCHRLRGDPAYVKKGSPVRDSSTPVGWCRFPLKKSSLAALSSLDTDDWHTAFHSTRPNLLREDDGWLITTVFV